MIFWSWLPQICGDPGPMPLGPCPKSGLVWHKWTSSMDDWFYDFELKCRKKIKDVTSISLLLWRIDFIISSWNVEENYSCWSWPINSGLWLWINFMIFLLKCHHPLTHRPNELDPDLFLRFQEEIIWTWFRLILRFQVDMLRKISWTWPWLILWFQVENQRCRKVDP